MDQLGIVLAARSDRDPLRDRWFEVLIAEVDHHRVVAADLREPSRLDHPERRFVLEIDPVPQDRAFIVCDMFGHPSLKEPQEVSTDASARVLRMHDRERGVAPMRLTGPHHGVADRVTLLIQHESRVAFDIEVLFTHELEEIVHGEVAVAQNVDVVVVDHSVDGLSIRLRRGTRGIAVGKRGEDL